jgi:hypothetical protein
MSQNFPLETGCADLSGLPMRHGCNMGALPVRLSFADPPLPRAVNDNPFPPSAESPPPPPPKPDRLTQRLDPSHFQDGASKGHARSLNDADKLHALRPALWDYLDAVEKAEGRRVKQDRALVEVMRAAREDHGYPELTRSRAQTAIVQVVWEMRGA